MKQHDASLPRQTSRAKPVSFKQVVDQYQQIRKQKDPAPEKVERFKRDVLENPETWDFARQTTEAQRRRIINLLGSKDLAPLLEAEEGVIKAQFGYDRAPELERILIDAILTARIRLVYTEHAHTAALADGSYDLISAEGWDGLLSRAQERFLRAVESLAKIRKAARNTPAMQVNIATEGARQLNMNI